MNKIEQYKLIEDFIGAPKPSQQGIDIVACEYNTYISDLWPVLGKCLDVARMYPERLMIAWLAIAAELYKIPEDISYLYECVIGFIEYFNQLKKQTNGK